LRYFAAGEWGVLNDNVEVKQRVTAAVTAQASSVLDSLHVTFEELVIPMLKHLS